MMKVTAKGLKVSEDQIKLMIPHGHSCVKGNYVCPFLDWLSGFYRSYDDFKGKGFCHYLKKGDWFNKESPCTCVVKLKIRGDTYVNPNQEGTCNLWDAVKECGVNID